MEKLLRTVVFDRYTVTDLLYLLGGVLVVLILIGFVRRLFSGRSPSPHYQEAVCSGCGWKGRVSRYAGRCPRCNRPLGDQKARTK